jgi:hypothetical protein
MDLYVNFQGLKYNFEKVWGVFAKLPGPMNFQNYFSIVKSVE